MYESCTSAVLASDRYRVLWLLRTTLIPVQLAHGIDSGLEAGDRMRKHNCIMTHGGGQPPRGVRRILHLLHHELKLPVYCLLDNDPWGYYIYSVIKQGSINLETAVSR